MKTAMTKSHSKKLARTLVVTSALVWTTACTTLQGGSSKEASERSVSETVLTQVSRKEALVSQHDRSYWLDMRQSKKLMPKLAGALATGEGEASVQLAKAYLAKNPGDVPAMTMLAQALAMTRNYDLADYYAMLALRKEPSNAAALNIRGLAMMLGSNRTVLDYHKAQNYFRQALDAEPSHVAAGLNGGHLALELGNPEAASTLFQQVVQRCGDCTPGLMGWGVALSRTGKHAEAASAFEKVLAKSQNNPRALYNLALVYKNGYNDGKRAEGYLHTLLDSSRTKDVALREKAQTVLRMIKGEAAREERTMIADDDDGTSRIPAAGEAKPSGDEKDAELLMTGAEMEDK